MKNFLFCAALLASCSLSLNAATDDPRKEAEYAKYMKDFPTASQETNFNMKAMNARALGMVMADITDPAKIEAAIELLKTQYPSGNADTQIAISDALRSIGIHHQKFARTCATAILDTSGDRPSIKTIAQHWPEEFAAELADVTPADTEKAAATEKCAIC